MCGIFGYVGAPADFSPNEILPSLSHRGPDDRGEYGDFSKGYYLSHRRLSILDLSCRGQQPMANEDRSIWLSFNGEVYNYKKLRSDLKTRGHSFQSQTDSEVIIHAYEEWGEDCLQKFNGMFAIALWDENKGVLFLARDRMGIKPLYFIEQNDGILFGSTPKPFLDTPFYNPGIDYNGLDEYLLYGYTSEETSIWKNVKKVEPGQYMTFNQSGQRLNKTNYWSIPLEQKNWEIDKAEEEYDRLFSSAVKQRLVSDVPLGVFLSGGNDSSSITASARKHVDDLNTFSIGFKNHSQSELSDAEIIANHFNTNHTKKTISKESIEELENVFKFFDEPLGDSSIIPTYMVSKLARESGVKVILSGDGADELFGGYHWYQQQNFYEKWGWIRHFLGPLTQLLGYRGDLLRRSGNPYRLYRWLMSPRFKFREIEDLFPDSKIEEQLFDDGELFRRNSEQSLRSTKKWQYIDAKTFLPSDLLVKVDRASMAHSLEVRVPFLDHRLVEFAFSLPNDLFIREGRKKFLVKQWLSSKVPSSALEKAKQGFSCPIFRYWDRGELVDTIQNGVLEGHGILNGTQFDEFQNTENDRFIDSKLWLIYVLEQWGRRWLEGNI